MCPEGLGFPPSSVPNSCVRLGKAWNLHLVYLGGDGHTCLPGGPLEGEGVCRGMGSQRACSQPESS